MAINDIRIGLPLKKVIWPYKTVNYRFFDLGLIKWAATIHCTPFPSIKQTEQKRTQNSLHLSFLIKSPEEIKTKQVVLVIIKFHEWKCLFTNYHKWYWWIFNAHCYRSLYFSTFQTNYKWSINAIILLKKLTLISFFLILTCNYKRAEPAEKWREIKTNSIKQILVVSKQRTKWKVQKINWKQK